MAHLAAFVVAVNGLEPELERAVGGLALGQWSGAVRTRVGWAVLRSLGREEAQRLDASDLRARVRRALENRRRQEARKGVLAAARTEILVDL